MSYWSSGLTCLLPVTRDPGSNPLGGLMWNRDFPVSNVLLHWWPRRDWSFLWPHLRRALSRTITRPSCRQCDNPTWPHTAFLSRFHARCRSPFRLHNWQSRQLGGSPVERLLATGWSIQWVLYSNGYCSIRKIITDCRPPDLNFFLRFFITLFYCCIQISQQECFSASKKKQDTFLWFISHFSSTNI